MVVDDHLVRERNLSEVVMTRKKKGGRRPRVTGAEMCKEWNDESLWLAASRVADEVEIKALLALAISVDVEYLMQNNLFKFGDTLYKQTEGGMKGSELICIVAKTRMILFIRMFRMRAELLVGR